MDRKLISCDTHMMPPPWLIDELPERLRDNVPDILERWSERDGERYLLIPHPGQEPMRIKIESDEQLMKEVNFIGMLGADATPWWDPKGRLIDMERENVVGVVLITNVVNSVDRRPEVVEAQIAYARLVNDWLYDLYKDHFDQFATGIYLPCLDPAACVAELERCAALGMRPGLLPDHIYDAPYFLPEWEPLWEAAAGLGVPLTLHVGSAHAKERIDRWSLPEEVRNPYPGSQLFEFYNQACQMGRTLCELTFSGVFQRHPDLQVIMTEGSAFWLAPMMEWCDYHWQGRFGSWGRSAMAKLDMELEELPSHYMKRQAHATFEWDPIAIHNRSFSGTKCLLWGNDYPHREGVYPDSQQYVEKQFAGVPEEDVDAITFSNAKALFGFGDL
jgi:predicted TIM-barrel fold metal-dependent hydrolase